MATVIRPGTIVTIKGGKYDGHGAQVRKVNEGKKTAQLLIAGKIVPMKLERLVTNE